MAVQRGANHAPLKLSVSTPERRHSKRSDVPFAITPFEIFQTAFHIL
ncbi:unnamed protein product, partial [marine sediment metagenome]